MSDSQRSGGRIEGQLPVFIDPDCTYYIPRRHLEEAGISLDGPSLLAELKDGYQPEEDT